MSAARFRKRPVVVEAFRMTRERREDNSEWPEWLNRAWQKEEGEPGAVSCLRNSDGSLAASRHIVIQTLEGQHLVQWGDWIIRGVAGELYPCKPEIFAATYDPIP